MISEFQGENRWLSNFFPVTINLDGRTYSSVEHAYMSAKSDSKGWKDKCASSYTPGQIKRLSRTIELVKNWDDVKISVMKKCLEQKFNQEPFKTKLLNTGTQHIQEGNRWGDVFWGVNLNTGKGQNNLGKLIMNIRQQLKEFTLNI